MMAIISKEEQLQGRWLRSRCQSVDHAKQHRQRKRAHGMDLVKEASKNMLKKGTGSEYTDWLPSISTVASKCLSIFCLGS